MSYGIRTIEGGGGAKISRKKNIYNPAFLRLVIHMLCSGSQSLEVMMYMMALAVRYPDNVSYYEFRTVSERPSTGS